MQLKEGLHQVGFVRRKVVEDHVDLALVGLCRDDLFQKRNKLLAGVPRSGLAENFPSLRIQGCVERERSMTMVFETVLFGSSRRERQAAVEPVQGLNGTLLIYAENGGILRRIQ